MNSVSFYCTRCGRLVSMSAELQGVLVYCPFCKQGLVVPDLGVSKSEPNVSSSKERAEEEGLNAKSNEPRRNYARRPGGKSSSVFLRSHLEPDKTKRVDIGKSLSVDWSARGEEEPQEPDESVFWVVPDISDDEFIERLNSESTPSIPRARAFTAPPVYVPEPEPWTQRVDWAKLGTWSGITLTLVACATLVSYGVLHWTSPNRSRPELVASEPISVEGVATYKTNRGRVEGDDGAFVFLFPEKAFDKPLFTRGASPSRDLPLDFDTFIEELTSKGGAFERAGFEGLFSMEVKEPGVYKVLAVSYNVGDGLGESDAKALREIGKYLFQPEETIRRNRYIWRTENIDGPRWELTLDFGKASN